MARSCPLICAMTPHSAVLIVGAGPAGLSLAISLAQAGTADAAALMALGPEAFAAPVQAQFSQRLGGCRTWSVDQRKLAPARSVFAGFAAP